jgi:hypothetical protein
MAGDLPHLLIPKRGAQSREPHPTRLQRIVAIDWMRSSIGPGFRAPIGVRAAAPNASHATAHRQTSCATKLLEASR